jgi:hypothetical protein
MVTKRCPAKQFGTAWMPAHSTAALRDPQRPGAPAQAANCKPDQLGCPQGSKGASTCKPRPHEQYITITSSTCVSKSPCRNTTGSHVLAAELQTVHNQQRTTRTQSPHVPADHAQKRN